MATTVPKLSSGGAVKIRFNSMDRGTTKWKEGTFEILEKDNKVNLCLRFNCGGATKTFQVLFHLYLPYRTLLRPLKQHLYSLDYVWSNYSLFLE